MGGIDTTVGARCEGAGLLLGTIVGLVGFGVVLALQFTHLAVFVPLGILLCVDGDGQCLKRFERLVEGAPESGDVAGIE